MTDDTVIPTPKVDSLESLRRLTRLLNLLALVACVAVATYVAGNFVAEALWPPAPVAQNFFGGDDGHHAVYLINPALRWLGRILLLPGEAQLLAGALFCWREKPGAWKLLGGAAMLMLSMLFWFASSVSCGC